VADDLFGVWLPALWTKKRPAGTPPLFIMHRFLSSDPVYAQAARELNRIRRADPKIMFRVWQGLLPVDIGAPRLYYPAAKKPPEAEELTKRMMAVLSENRAYAEEMQAIVAALGKERDLYLEFGVEPPDEPKPEKQTRRKKKEEPPDEDESFRVLSGGLLDEED